jgi:mannose-1-phosphate guanylyltransferase
LNDLNFILEPAPRGTASVIGLGAIHLRRRDPQAVMACLTADHYIPAKEAFQNLLQGAYEIASQGNLVTLGITPTSADTGYGYIHRGEKVDLLKNQLSYQVQSFKEKPDPTTAQKYLESGEYLWNSGMFIWKVDAILKEIERQLPDLFKCLMSIDESIGSELEKPRTDSLWMDLASITVDYGVMEGAKQVMVLPADNLDWIDIGDWARLFDILPHDEDGNVIVANSAELLDSSGVLVYQDVDRSKRLITGLGLSDVVIIDSGDALFVCSKERAADIKRLIQRLTEIGLDRYL